MQPLLVLIKISIYALLLHRRVLAAYSGEDESGSCPSGLGNCGNISSKALTLETLPKRIVEAKYAVRGEILDRANQLQAELDAGNTSFPFKKLIPCHIGNPQSVGANPLTFHRQLLSILANPGILTLSRAQQPDDVIERAETYLKHFPKFGAYSESKGVAYLREQVAQFIARRDRTEAPSIENIYLTDGASNGIVSVLEMLISDSNSGVLIPIPQYPLYSGTIVRLGGQMVNYYLTEEDRWSLSVTEVEAQISKARAKGIDVKALVVINPGNPTGNILTKSTMEAIVKLCEREKLVILADEVYQDNIWQTERPWVSFRSVMLELGSKVELFSFHSTSKGFYGECGLRGGYMELANIDPAVNQQILKLKSMSLCANTLGQAMIASVVTPPKAETTSSKTYEEERAATLASLARKAAMVHQAFNSVEGMSAQPIDGAMYIFPSIKLPAKYVQKAEAAGRAPDMQYCLDLLEATGVILVPGSGFGQREGTHHFRMTILPDESSFPSMLKSIQEFHTSVLKSYSGGV